MEIPLQSLLFIPMLFYSLCLFIYNLYLYITLDNCIDCMWFSNAFVYGLCTVLFTILSELFGLIVIINVFNLKKNIVNTLTVCLLVLLVVNIFELVNNIIATVVFHFAGNNCHPKSLFQAYNILIIIRTSWFAIFLQPKLSFIIDCGILVSTYQDFPEISSV